MLYPLARSLLFRLDAENAHRAGIRAARVLAHHGRLAGLLRGAVARPGRAPIRIADLDFPHPVGLAAGLDKNAEAAMAWWAFGFGFVELGTVTPRPQPGKPRPRLFRFPQQRAIVNRMGFNNDGAAAVAARLRQQAELRLRPPFPIGLSIGRNADTPPEQTAGDYAMAAKLLAPHADYLAVNVSSPNTTGLRDLQSSVQLTSILRAIRAVAPRPPLFVKLAPELSGEDLESVLETCVSEGVRGIIATNTLATMGRDGLPEGGLSGRPLRQIALEKVAIIRRQIAGRAALIGCGGIEDADSAQAMLDAGADLIQLYTALVYRGPLLAARISRAIKRRGVDK